MIEKGMLKKQTLLNGRHKRTLAPNGEEDVVVELRALVGDMLEQHHLISTNGFLKKELDLQQPAGIYLITVCSKNDCITQKLMIAQ